MSKVKVRIPPEIVTIFGNSEDLAIRLVVLTNGTAAVAVLAFLGTIWAYEARDLIAKLALSLHLLIMGAGCGCLASLINYFACYKAAKQPSPPGEFDTVEEFKIWFANRQHYNKCYTYTVMFLLAIGFVCFLTGLGTIFGVFESLISELPANIPVTP